MRKLYAILVTLLFITSVFGVTQTMATANCNCEEEYYTLSKTTVRVGETFEGSMEEQCVYFLYIENIKATDIPGLIATNGLPLRIGPVELISGDVEDTEEGWKALGTFRAVTPGVLVFRVYEGEGEEDCNEVITVTVLPKSMPMNFFMKIIGFGKK